MDAYGDPGARSRSASAVFARVLRALAFTVIFKRLVNLVGYAYSFSSLRYLVRAPQGA